MMDCMGCERCKVWGKLQVTGRYLASLSDFSIRNGTTYDLNISDLSKEAVFWICKFYFGSGSADP
jgi:hypothetical protein